jgi:hypothetical protein
VGGRLVGYDIGTEPASQQLGEHVGGVPEEPYRFRPTFGARGLGPVESFVDRFRSAVEVARVEPPLDPMRVDLDTQSDTVVHRDGQRLGSTHASETGGQNDSPLEASPVVHRGELGQRLVRALQDPLRSDVDPGTCGHLAVHSETHRFQAMELVPVRPVWYQHRVRDQHARGPCVGAEHADGLPRLHEECLVVL